MLLVLVVLLLLGFPEGKELVHALLRTPRTGLHIKMFFSSREENLNWASESDKEKKKEEALACACVGVGVCVGVFWVLLGM